MGLATALAGIGLAGGVFSSFNQMSAGKQEKQAYDYNAQIAEQEALNIEESAKLDEFKKRKNLRSFVGEQRAGYASAGVEMTGSPLDVISDDIADAELGIAIDNYNSKMMANKQRSMAGQYRRTGSQAERAGYMKAGGTFLSTIGNTGAKFYNPSSSSNPLQVKGGSLYTGGTVKSGNYSIYR